MIDFGLFTYSIMANLLGLFLLSLSLQFIFFVEFSFTFFPIFTGLIKLQFLSLPSCPYGTSTLLFYFLSGYLSFSCHKHIGSSFSYEIKMQPFTKSFYLCKCLTNPLWLGLHNTFTSLLSSTSSLEEAFAMFSFPLSPNYLPLVFMHYWDNFVPLFQKALFCTYIK